MKEETITMIKALIRETTGILINTENTGDLAALAEERRASLRLDEAKYLHYLASARDETVAIASRFTVQESSFYRYREHFDRLKLQVLPELIRRKQQAGERRLLFISAGCANGEEPYTIAMIVHDLLKDHPGWEVRIIAIDINAQALQQAREGVYSQYRLRNIDPWYSYRYFEEPAERNNASLYAVKDVIRRMVEFRQANLLQEPFPLTDLSGADVILCENVIIYFSMESIQRLIDRFFEILTPEGFLFLGPSETLNIVNHRFELSWWNESFAYRKPFAAAPGPVRRGPPAEPADLLATADIPYPELIYLILQSFEAEQYQTAADLLRRTEKAGTPLTDVYHLIKAEFLYENRQYMQAANECREAISLSPKAAEAHLLLGAIYLDIGMFDNAHFEFQTALYLEPASALGYYYLSQYHDQTGNPGESEYCLDYAKLLLAIQGNVLSGKTFPLYQARRATIYSVIKNARPHPDIPSRG
jgi:chemotaxis protein methyltransferase CheR